MIFTWPWNFFLMFKITRLVFQWEYFAKHWPIHVVKYILFCRPFNLFATNSFNLTSLCFLFLTETLLRYQLWYLQTFAHAILPAWNAFPLPFFSLNSPSFGCLAHAHREHFPVHSDLSQTSPVTGPLVGTLDHILPFLFLDFSKVLLLYPDS